MNYPEISQDDLFDLGFEPVILENTVSIDYEHKELDIRLWKGIRNPEPKWNMGYGKEKVQFDSLDQLKEYMASKAEALEAGDE